MEDVLLEYLKKIQDLLKYIDGMQEINNLLAGNYNELLSQKVQKIYREPAKRVFDYNLVIITLYGILEGFIEQNIERYLEEISVIIKDYNKLPEKIKENHWIYSAELIINSKRLAKYSNVIQEDVIKNLWSCVDKEKPYKLNGRAFTNHNSNFRKDTIREVFKNIGIDNITGGIIKDGKFRLYFVNYEGITEEELEYYTEDSYYAILHDIVERRNYIAHGNEVDDILSLPILKSYVLYIKILLESVYRILYKSINILRIKHGNKIYLGYPTKVYNNSIIGLYNNHHEIREGMFIFSENSQTGEIRYGKIISIENNGEIVKTVDKNANVLLGIKVDFKAKSNYKFGILE